MSDPKNTRGGKTDDEIAVAAARASYLRKRGIVDPPETTHGEELARENQAARRMDNFDGSDEASGMIRRRYRDAYLVAKVVVGFGKVIRIVGIITASTLILLGSIAFGHSGFPAQVVCVVVGAVLGGVIYFFGALIGTQGQMQYALLDVAVNTSPVLPVVDKARVIIDSD
jgi:hypothetical protein